MSLAFEILILIALELRPEYVETLKKIRKGEYTKFGSIDELGKITS